MADFLFKAKDNESIGRSDASLEVCTEFEPDEARALRALLLIAGLPPDEVERMLSDLALDSPREM